MSSTVPEFRSHNGPAGRRTGRTIITILGHTGAVVVLATLGLTFAAEPLPGMHDHLVYGRSAAGRLEVGGASDNPIGTIDSNYKLWRIRGVGGLIGFAASGTTVRSGAHAVDRLELLTASQRLLDYQSETGGITARCWCREEPFLLFEPAAGVAPVLSATITTAAAAWGLLFTGLRLGFRESRAIRSRKLVSAGKCPYCSYPRPRADRCPECGSAASDHSQRRAQP